MGESKSAHKDEVEAVRLGIELGMTLIDTAEAYRSSEEVIGRGLASWPGPRDRMVIATKVRSDALSAGHVVEAVERSLRLLGVETIDLLQAHGWDARTRSRRPSTP